MIIGIDGNEANIENRVGIGEYAYELLRHFEKFRISSIEFRIYLKAKPLPHMPKQRIGWNYVIVRPPKLWTQIGLPIRLMTEFKKPDVFFSPSHYAPRFSPIPTAISIMDMSYVLFPELFNKDDLYQLVNWTKYSARNAKKIFTISNSSKADIIKEYGLPAKRIVVTYLGARQSEEAKKMDIKNKYGVNSPFILFVGTIQPRKNIARLIEAYSMLKTDAQLVIVGKKGWKYEEILEAPAKFRVTDRVKFLDYIPEEDLPHFYKNAKFFILPSLYEGFGLPVLEAMKNDCPVITSSVSSLPEAGGDAALYVDPESTADIAAKMQKLLDSEDLRSDLIKKGREQVKKFSWEKTARETLKVLESIANG